MFQGDPPSLTSKSLLVSLELLPSGRRSAVSSTKSTSSAGGTAASKPPYNTTKKKKKTQGPAPPSLRSFDDSVISVSRSPSLDDDIDIDHEDDPLLLWSSGATPRASPGRHFLGNAALWWLIFAAVVAVCAACSCWAWLWCLPAASSSSAPVDDFSEGRARDMLHTISAFAPTRYAGTAELLDTADYIVSQLYKIDQEKTNPGVKMEIQFWNTSGGGSPFTQTLWSSYPLIAAHISTNDSLSDALLLCSHLDSAIGSEQSQGYIEISNTITDKLVQLSSLYTIFSFTKTKSSLIAVFGVDVEGQMGAYNFMTGSGWNKDVRAVINIDSVGAASQGAVLVQTNLKGLSSFCDDAPRLLSVPILDDFLRKRLVGTNTDLSVFRSFGIPGLEFTHVLNAEVFFTESDTLDSVVEGAIQHDGDTLMHVVNNLLTSDLSRVNQSRSYVALSGPGMQFVVSIESTWIVALCSMGFTVTGVILYIIITAKRASKPLLRVAQQAVMFTLSFMFALLEVLLGIGFPVILSAILVCTNATSFNANHYAVGSMSILASCIGIICAQLLFSYCIFSVIFLYPIIGCPLAISIHFFTKYLFKSNLKKWKTQLWVPLLLDWVPFLVLVWYPFFFGFPSVIFSMAALGPRLIARQFPGSIFFSVAVAFFFLVSIQCLMAFSYGGKDIIMPSWPLWPLFRTQKYDRDRIQGARSIGRHWVLIILLVPLIALLIASIFLPAFTNSMPLRYVPNYIFDSSTNSSFISIVPEEGMRVDEIMSHLHSNGYPDAFYCKSFWSDSRGVCVNRTLYSDPPELIMLDHNEWHHDGSYRAINFHIDKTRHPRFNCSFNCELGTSLKNLTINGVLANSPLTSSKFSGGNPQLTTHTISATTLNMKSCNVTVWTQSPDTDDALSGIIDSMPSWTTVAAIPDMLLPVVTVLYLHIPEVLV
ncbi:hypothetical protein Pelo_17117 [Pelomyxa schiedti]|nr:hypothetical protein Pelo_17117 [Pelomyxa schiedti]